MCSHYVIFKPCFPRENRHAMLLLRQLAWNKFPKKFKHTSLRAVREQYLNILMLTKHLPRVTVCAHWDPQVTRTDLGKHWGAPDVRRDRFSTNVTSPRHCGRAPMLSVINEVLNTRCRYPWGSQLCYKCKKQDSIRYTQRQEFTNNSWLTHGLYNEYL